MLISTNLLFVCLVWADVLRGRRFAATSYRRRNVSSHTHTFILIPKPSVSKQSSFIINKPFSDHLLKTLSDLANWKTIRSLRFTQAVVSIVGQPEAIVARASVVSRDVDALVNAAAVIFAGTLIDICGRDWKTVSFLHHYCHRFRLRRILPLKITLRLGETMYYL